MTAHAYWAIEVTDVSGDPLTFGVAIDELKMFGTVGGADLCTGGTSSATSEYDPSYVAANAFDSTALYWNSAQPLSPPQKLIYHFASAVDIVGYSVTVIGIGTDDNPKSWNLIYSDDGVAWTTVSTQTGIVFASLTRLFNVGVVDIPATALTSAPTLNNPTANVVINATATALTSTPSLSSPAVNYIQDIPATALTSSPTLNVPTVGIIAKTPITVLTATPTLNNPTAMSVQRVDAVPLFSTPTINNPSVGVINIVSAYPLYSTPSLAVNDANYLGYAYGTETKAITNYSNFNFTGSCVFNGKTLLINDTGIFEYGGESDNGIAIVASIKTGKMNGVMGRNGVYPSNKIKRIPDAKIVIDCDKSGGEVTVNVTADENAPLLYANAISHSGFATHRVPIGRGIKFNYVQLEVIGTGCAHLDISSIEYNPVENVRSER